MRAGEISAQDLVPMTARTGNVASSVTGTADPNASATQMSVRALPGRRAHYQVPDHLPVSRLGSCHSQTSPH
jgi:hypothetical protein